MSNETCARCGNKDAIESAQNVDFSDDYLKVTVNYECPFCGRRWSILQQYGVIHMGTFRAEEHWERSCRIE